MSYITTIEHDDLSVFRNRILYLMEDLLEKEKSGKNENEKKGRERTGVSVLAEKLYETNLFKSKNKYTVSIAKDSIVKTIQKHLTEVETGPDLPPSLTAAHVKAYCKVFNCSADFLLGNTTAVTTEASMRSVIDITGLSENAVEKLLLMTSEEHAIREVRMSADESRQIISNIIESPIFAEFVRELKDADDIMKRRPKALDNLKAEIGKKRFKRAIELDGTLDDDYNEPISEQEIEDYQRIREAMDKDYAADENARWELKLCKYSMNEHFSAFIKERYCYKPKPEKRRKRKPHCG